jgi:hypothetical protein
MNELPYIPYFAINPHGAAVPKDVMQAAMAALENQLGGAWQVLAARTAYEEAGRQQAARRGKHTAAIKRWRLAAEAAAQAACYTAQRDGTDQARIDVVAAARYGYTEAEWLNVFTAHFGLSDYCDSHQQALNAGRHWLAIAPGACPIAAADQEIHARCMAEA